MLLFCFKYVWNVRFGRLSDPSISLYSTQILKNLHIIVCMIPTPPPPKKKKKKKTARKRRYSVELWVSKELSLILQDRFPIQVPSRFRGWVSWRATSFDLGPTLRRC